MASSRFVRLLPRAAVVAGVVAATLALSACVVAPVGYQGEVIGVAPPPMQAEVVGPPPVVGYVWIGGYWNWVGGRHVWAPGYWSAPRPGHYWVPHRWEPVPGGWRHQPGHWQRR